ncbi:MAG: thiol-disulfide oxidoreductase DCC family protein [Gammaproteobacteria bacterium]|nr:thiol-disulfide oxidoreductase DCC family protein [Gammaproteobacteria bacterium]
MNGPPGNHDPGHRIVLYDGICNLCNASVRFIINRDPDGLYRFAHLQSSTGSDLARRYGIDPDITDSFVLIAHNRASIKSDAWLAILESLGGIWSAARALRVIPRPVRDAVYDLVGRTRYRVFGKTTYCQTPAPDASGRFLHNNNELPQRRDDA